MQTLFECANALIIFLNFDYSDHEFSDVINRKSILLYRSNNLLCGPPHVKKFSTYPKPVVPNETGVP